MIMLTTPQYCLIFILGVALWIWGVGWGGFLVIDDRMCSFLCTDNVLLIKEGKLMHESAFK